MVDVTGAEIRIPQKPSEVFLKAIQALAIADPEMPGTEFKEYAEAWRQICHLEEIYAAAERKTRWENLLAYLTPSEDKKGPGDPSPSAQDDSTPHPSTAPTPSPQGEGLTYDCASAPMPDADEAKKAQEAANRSAGGRAGFATRKKNLTERVEALRRRGAKLHEIAAAGPGLSINDVMDSLEAKAMSPMKIQALEKACRKLEEAELSGGKDS